jgi:hypothetical protein
MKLIAVQEGRIELLAEVGPEGYYEAKDFTVPFEAWQSFRGVKRSRDGSTTIQFPAEVAVTIQWPTPSKP